MAEDLALALGVENESNDETGRSEVSKTEPRRGCPRPARHLPVETQDFSKDENQNHAHKDPRLFHVGPDALVAHDADAIAGRQAREADRQPARQVHEPATVRLRVSSLFPPCQL